MMDPDSFYVKIFNRNISNCGYIDCGCIIVEIDSPYIVVKLCKNHEYEVKQKRPIHVCISPCRDSPYQFESLHLAAVGSKVFD